MMYWKRVLTENPPMKTFCLIFVVSLLWSLTAAAGTAPEQAFASAFRAEVETHSTIQTEDAYKFCHQSVMGPGHMMGSPADVKSYLMAEIKSLKPIPQGAPAESLLVTLSDQPRLVRLNLRPFVAQQGSLDSLVAAMIATEKLLKPDPVLLETRLSVAVDVLDAASQGSLAKQLRDLMTKMKPAGFPALHHSDGYNERYAPAYRVIDPSQLPGR
jgi:hypothetical protein